MGDTETSATSGPAQQLWYCVKCTRMITPPGAEGFVTSDGEHLCPDCAPAKRGSSIRIKPAEAPKSGSKPNLKAVDTQRTGSKPTLKAIQVPAPPAGASATSKSSAARPAAAKTAPKPFPAIVAFGAGGAVMLVIGVLVLSSSGKPPESTQGERAKPAAAIAREATAPGLPPAAPSGSANTGSAATGAATPGTPAAPVHADSRITGPSFMRPVEKAPAAGAAPPDRADAPALGALDANAAAPKDKESGLQAFKEGLQKATQSDEKGRYGAALDQLKDLKARFAKADWWDDRKGDVDKAEQLVQQHLTEYATEADDAVKLVRQADKPDALGKWQSQWKSRLNAVLAAGQPVDEASARPARQVLKAIHERCAQLAEQQAQSVLAETAKQVEALERALKNRPINMVASRDALAKIDAALGQTGVITEDLAERLAGVRFDLAPSYDAQLAKYKVPLKPAAGGAVELLYDGAALEQLGAWLLDDGGDAAVEKNAFVLKHHKDKNNKRDTRIVRLPFDCFQPGQWSIEAEVSLATDRNKLEYGLCVLDGSGNIVRLTVKQATYKDVFVSVGGTSPVKGGLKQKPKYLPGPTKELVQLKMSCQQGMVVCYGVNAANRPVAFDPEKLGFAPHFLGLFMQVCDREEECSAVFGKLKVTGQLNLEPLRKAACAAARKDAEAQKPLYKDWLILGPFPGAQASPWQRGAALDVAAMLNQPQTNPAWQRPFSPASYGVVDLAGLLKPNEEVYAYAAAEVEAERNTEGLLLLGSDDGVTVWLDGCEIHRYPKPRGVKIDDDKVTLRLAPGTHTLVLRIDQGKGDWGFCARLASSDGKGPLAGVQLRCASPAK